MEVIDRFHFPHSNFGSGLRHAQPLRLPWWVTSCIILSTLSVAISPFIVSSDGGVFGANLLALHFLLLAPPLLASNFRTSQTPRPFIPDGRMEVIYATATRVSSLYAFLTGTFLISHMVRRSDEEFFDFSPYISLCLLFFFLKFQMAQLVTSTLATTATETQSASQVLELILSQLWTGIWINHCQTSITMDYFFGSIAALIYMISEGVVKRNRISITTTLLLFTPFLSAAFTLPLFMSLREGWKIEENVIDIIEEKKKY